MRNIPCRLRQVLSISLRSARTPLHSFRKNRTTRIPPRNTGEKDFSMARSLSIFLVLARQWRHHAIHGAFRFVALLRERLQRQGLLLEAYTLRSLNWLQSGT